MFKIDKTEPINPHSRQLIIGSLLGDGGIKHRSENSYIFVESHGKAQKDYLRWKMQRLEQFCPSWWEGESQCQIQTVTHDFFEELRRDFYGDRTRKHSVELKYAEELDLFGFLVWFLDDGCCSKEKQTTIGSKTFAFNNLTDVCTRINEHLDLHLYVRQEKNGDSHYNRMCIPANDRDRLFPIWRAMIEEENVPDCVSYKVAV